MTDAPIFPDCAVPEDCECATRGYQYERTSCAVPGVRASAARLAALDLHETIRRWPPGPPQPDQGGADAPQSE